MGGAREETCKSQNQNDKTHMYSHDFQISLQGQDIQGFFDIRKFSGEISGDRRKKTVLCDRIDNTGGQKIARVIRSATSFVLIS